MSKRSVWRWPFEKARDHVRAQNLKSVAEYRAWCKSSSKPDGIPQSPNTHYEGQGWTTWGDWLGTGRVAARPLTLDEVVEWMRVFKAKYGMLPGPHEKREVVGQPNEKWSLLDAALLQGLRKLPSGNSLTRLGVSHFGARNPADPPKLTVAKIVEALRAFQDEHGSYPAKDKKEPVPGHPGDTWSSIEAALRYGGRGLPGDSSLAKLREEVFGVVNRKNQTPLDEPLIITWMSAFLDKYGVLPTSKETREVPGQPNEAWSRIDGCLHVGARGLKGGRTLVQLGKENFPSVAAARAKLSGTRKGREFTPEHRAKMSAARKGKSFGPRRPDRPARSISPPLPPMSASVARMTEGGIVEWMREFQARYGELPKSSEKREVPGQPAKNWMAINTALKQGLNDLPGESSLAKLKEQHFGYQHHLNRPDLSEASIVEWMRESHTLHGVYPSQADVTPVPDRPDENWQALNLALRNGLRGLPGGASLAALKERHFGVIDRWSVARVRDFVRGLIPHLASLTPGELWVTFQQSGALDTQGRGGAFLRALVTGRFPQGELERFASGQPSRVDDFFNEPESGGGEQPAPTNEVADGEPEPLHDVAGEVTEGDADASTHASPLPTVSVSGILGALNAAIFRASDSEAIEFLLASGKAKLWRKVFRDEAAAVAEAQAFVGTGYADAVRDDFLREYEAARSLPIPKGYAFVPRDNTGENPNLMQRLVASRIQREHRMGNWSGTGTGKTNAATLASRVVGAKLTVVCCPNSVVEGWGDAVRAMFPDSTVVCKTFEPDWGRAKHHRYLVVNYEMFQQPGAEARVRAFAENQQIDFVVIDEIQFVKQRSDDVSRRREMVGAMLTLATKNNPDLYVLGLSATPAINNLREPIALIEMISGKMHDDLEPRPTVANCMRVYQRLTTLGPRWLMDHKTGCERREIAVDCSEFVEEIRRLGRRGTPLQLEEILTKARLPTILDALVPKTIVYTYYVGGAEPLDRQLYEAITAKGWRAGFFTGDEKSGLDGFLEGDLDVLIASSAISTGVDKLQHVCNRLVINVLPWTAAEFEQLIGRIHRQGQKRNVAVVIPITHADVNGQEWSWCKAKMQRLHFKKSVADAAVDGIVPEGHLRSQEKAYQDLMAWLERLSTGEVVDVERPALVFTLPESADTLDKRRARFGDFSLMNARWNRSDSSKTHERLERDPAEWRHYHDELARVRQGWPADPQEEFLRWAQRRTDLIIGDFGCGRAKVRASLADRHAVHSFDHVAVTEDVVACDMAHVPLEDEMLDVALFCLSMMGSNVTDYVREAHRTLKLDGWLHIYEPTARFSDREAFARSLRALGFGNIEVNDVGAFSHVSARKTEHHRQANAEVSGLGG